MTSDDVLPNNNHDTVKWHLVRSIPRVPPDESVASALPGLVGNAFDFAGTAAMTIGLGFPLILSRLGKDPALGSGPLATIIQDVLSLIIYFTVITLLVS